jgi:kynurenine formamidase
MCAPSVIETALAGLSRRELLQLAAAVTAGAAFAPSTLKAAEEPVVRAIELGKIMDLTHTLSPEFPVFPVPGLTFPIKITAIARLEIVGVFANKWELIEHNGTHIDAPCHFIAKTQTLEQLPLRSLIVPAAVIDISARARKDADSAVTIDDVKAWEKQHGRLPRGSGVFMYSGWDAKVGDPQAYLGTDRSNTLHFPGFAENTCDFLVKERDISGVGVDTLSLDIGPEKEYKAHKALFRANKWGIECVANLSRIPPSGATVFVGATKVKGGSGGPARLIACWA